MAVVRIRNFQDKSLYHPSGLTVIEHTEPWTSLCSLSKIYINLDIEESEQLGNLLNIASFIQVLAFGNHLICFDVYILFFEHLVQHTES